GSTENNWDELIVLDSDGVTNLNAATPYGAAGDLTGLQFTSSGDTITVGVTSDGSGISCTSDPWNFDVFCLDTTALPNCNASLTDPLNGAAGVNENTNLTWSAASIFVTGYTLYMGTTPGGTDVLNGVDVGDVLTYNIPTTLDFSTTYYVTIIPYNDNGNAINCTEESFTTRNDPNQIIDCSANQVVNTVHCYDSNENEGVMAFNFASNDGSPLYIVFNSGQVENGWDELFILDSDGTTNLNAATPYGAAGDLTGLTYTSTGNSLTVFVESDGIISCQSQGYTPWDFDVGCVDTTALPNCNASLTSPLNGAVDVSENNDLTWSPASVFVTGYTLYMGTTPGGTDVLNGVDVGNVLTYNPGTLDYSTTYYVTIIPYNDNGDATNCTEESFTTRPDPNQIIDCAAGQILNTVFCYENGIPMWTEIFSFQSSDGSPLNMTFNSGTIETCCDTIRIEEGDGTLIYQGTGVGGDLAGLSFFSTTDRMVMFYEADGSISCSSGSRVEWDFDVSCFDPTAPPNCNADLVAPADGATDVAINTTITWSPASIIVTGYTISIGTTPGGTDIADNVDVGNVLTYNPGILTNATFYYVTVTPYNDNGLAIDCIEQSFKTVCIPHVVTFNAIGDCITDPENPDFMLEVNIADLSGSASIIVSDDQGSPNQTATAPGIITMGPYAANTVVTITTIKSDDDTCDVISSPITFICPPPPNPCSIIYAGEDVTIGCEESTDLTANYHLFGQDTSTYIINGLDACPQPSTVGGTGTSINTDDVWSEVLEIGFEFCFFGDTYSQILIGSNGVLSFELENANGGNGWAMAAGDLLPNNTNPTLAEANIFGVGHDIDPGVCGNINYLVIGSAPYRQFVVNFTSVCHFSCNSIESSSQIILYESSNNIDVNIFDKPTCSSWNGGRAVVGVQNINGTTAFTPPGRNTGVWTATDEFWRFAPSEGTPNYSLEWFDGTTSIGNTDTVTVSPTVTTTYTASVTYELCTGGTATISDDVTVTVITDGTDDPSFTMTPTCDGGTATITGTPGGTFEFDPVPTDGAVIDPDTGTVTGGTPGETYTIKYVVLTTGTCPASSFETVTVLDAEDASFTMTADCTEATATITGDTGGTFAFNPEPGDGAMINNTTGEITNGVPGTTYTVEYTTSGSCSTVSTQMVTLLPGGDASFTLTANCSGATATITGDTGGTFAFNPIPTDGATINPVTGEITNGVVGTTYTVEYTTVGTCPTTNSQSITIPIAEDASFTMSATCDGGTATITGDTGGTFAFNPLPGDGATINTGTGEVTNGTPGTTYTVEYTTSGPCPSSSTQMVTVLGVEDASFAMTPSCSGATATIIGDTGGTFAFNPLPTDGATIDASTGEITNGVPEETYTVEYTTSGPCPETGSGTITLLASTEDASFSATPTCDGAIVTITGDAGGTFILNPPPQGGAVINPVTGEVTGGAPNTYYTIEYTTSGPCPVTSDETFLTETCVIPQVITPNGDGSNDSFDLSGFDVNSLEIFNRNGIKVYSRTNGYQNEFLGISDKGDELPTGTYFYVMKYRGDEVRSDWVYINREK
ncbi:T9SS type B sorting domain-containing protein, partial [Xanthomarina spongicola]